MTSERRASSCGPLATLRAFPTTLASVSMLTDELRARLERLNRDRLPEPSATRTAAPAIDPMGEGAVDTSLEAVVAGQVVDTPEGEYYLVRRPLDELWDRAGQLVRVMDDARASGFGIAESAHPDSAAFVRAFPRGLLLLDLETCGFAGSPLFLVGLLRHADGRLVLEQLLARTYAEERAVLASLAQCIAASDVLVSFNGKSFDVPMVRDRFTYHRLDAGHEERLDALPHFDLLHHARRRWKSLLPNCRLQTLERHVCRRLRRDDIPGSQIPIEYHHFVRTGDARQIAQILEHNALDLITLVELAVRIAAAPVA
jgi:uncharacterized protein YprB with RNaseH-like and TPR domain